MDFCKKQIPTRENKLELNWFEVIGFQTSDLNMSM